MKHRQLPRVASALYGSPWSILPESHAELGMLYRSYIRGELQPFDSDIPQSLEKGGKLSSGISYQADHSQGIAILILEGIISKRAPDMMCGPQLVDLSKLDGLLDEIAADNAIETVIFDWNSPGGMVIGLQETADRTRELSAMGKRTIAYTDFQMCSAAYYHAAACDEIYAAPSAVIGSIGTYCAGLDDSRAWEMEGLELILAKSGSLKAMGHPGKAWTEEEREWLQEKADKCGAEFRDWVTSRRPGISAETMQGQWFYAKDRPELTDGFYRDLPALLADLMNPV
jgi:capsid assembly protease